MKKAYDYLGKKVTIEMDRPLGTKHPKHDLFIWLIMDLYLTL